MSVPRQCLRELGMIGAGVMALVAAFALNMAHGEARIGVGDIIRSFAYNDDLLRDVVSGFRLPRATIGVLAGSGFAVSGALMQSILRNPMVSPGILGISAGSFFFIALATIFAPALIVFMPIAVAVCGGLVAVLMVYLLAGGFRATPLRILLAGLIVAMTISSITGALLLLYESEARFLITWSAGSLRQNGWSNVQLVWPWIVLCLIAAFTLSRAYDIARLGEDTARSLGQKHALLVTATLIVVLVLTGASVAATGPIGFVGLVAPHLVKLAGVRRHAALIPAAALWGSSLLLAADSITYMLGSLTSAPPVGAITAALGAPWLLWLVLRRSRGGQMNAASSLDFGRAGHVSPTILLLALLLLIGLTLLAGLMFVGGLPLSGMQVMQALSGKAAPLMQKIVWDMRGPRILAACLAGAGFALAGALFQAALRNPLADSSIVGVNGGATAGILLMVALFPAASATGIGMAALAGGMLAAATVYILAWRTRLTPTFLILIGISVSALCGAFVQILVMQTRFTDNPMVWLIGGLYGANWSTVQILFPTLLAGFICAMLVATKLELLSLGDITARSLGAAIAPVRLAAGATGVTVAAICVSQTGPVGYVGLLAPHLARFLCGHSLRAVLPVSVLVGALLLGLADIAARLVIAPGELPAGSVIALIGAPYLIYLIRRSMRT
ncbi:iron ABC transporter permease [Halomonas sp. FME65]|uniref:iron ABC transporter permease n=1 Tax=Halomonas sp. FME65 TaxID=2742614 RepID=UPI001867E62E|nr:iron ABC transporter permease [Halomonas sp. FME65]